MYTLAITCSVREGGGRGRERERGGEEGGGREREREREKERERDGKIISLVYTYGDSTMVHRNDS